MSLTGPPPPVPAALAATAAGTDPAAGTPTIIGILDARGPDRLASSISDVLHAASGPGNIITGRVAEIRPDGTVFLTTPSGAELSFRHPPEVPIEVGSTITLRLVAIVPAPQAVLLAVDGRSVAGLLSRAGAAARSGATDLPPAAVTPAGTAAAIAGAPRPAGPADLGISIAAGLVATLGRDSASAPAALPGAPVTVGAAAGSAPAVVAEAESAPVVAVLIRTAPPRPGVTAPVVGTRYLLSISAVAQPSGEPGATLPPAARNPAIAPATLAGPTLAAPAATPATATPTPALSLPQETPATVPASSATPLTETGATLATSPVVPPPAVTASAPSQVTTAAALPSGTTPSPAVAGPSPAASPSPAPAPPPQLADDPAPPDLAGFTPQAALLAGRVAAPRQDGEILVETAVGTLALPQPAEAVPAGSAVHLRVTAVARPQPTIPTAATPSAAAASQLRGSDQAGPIVPQTALQQALAVLATLQPNLAKAASDAFVLQPGAQLAALIFGFLAGVQGGAAKRWTDSPARAALDALDHGELREKLDDDAVAIGSQSLPTAPDGWKITVLPYLGAASLQPARLYQRAAEARIEEEEGGAASAAGQRFVVEIELRRLGPLQFDGLVRERRFDLAIRSSQPFDATLQAEIGHIFRETIGISGYAGDLVFGRLARFPLLPTASQTGVHEISA